MNEQTDLKSYEELTLDDIIKELDGDYFGDLPETALRAAQARHEEITPRLIDVIRQATDAARAGDVPQEGSHFFALFLLTEFRAKEALPAIIEAISLPNRLTNKLFGDAITECLPRVLAELAGDQLDLVDGLVADSSIDEFVRWSAAEAFLLLVRDGSLTRDDAVARLRRLLVDAVANEDKDAATLLVTELLSFSPREVLDEIEEAFERGLVDEMLVDLEEVHESIAEGESRFQQSLEGCEPTGIDDTVEELRDWALFAEPETDDFESDINEDVWSAALEEIRNEDWSEPLDDAPRAEPPDTIRNSTARVGRNEPCPCGSGKKHKKCCGAN